MFEDKRIRRKRRYLLAAVFLLLASAAFGVGYFFNAEPPGALDDPTSKSKVNLKIPDNLINPTTSKEPYEQVNADSNVDQAVNMPEKDLLTPNTQLIFKTYYNSCRHTAEKAVQAVNDEVNMSEQQLKEKPIEAVVATIQDPTPHKAILKYQVYFESLVKVFNDLLGTLTEIKEADPEEYERYKGAIGKLMDRMRGQLQ
jgi:hypothetical protein